jgi:cytochrome b subunit of formate dehydrogenase
MAFEDVRHKLPDRVFHWTMAILVIILMGSAFLPIVGINFNWIPVHWISGMLLTLAVVFHLYRALFVHGIATMMPNGGDIRDAMGRGAANDAGKYDLNQKLYHWSVSLIMLVLVISGLIMLAKIDTPFWNRDPAILSDWNWGVVYSLHGAASMLLIFFFILHIYFALLPEHRQLLTAMVFGKIRTDGKTGTLK